MKRATFEFDDELHKRAKIRAIELDMSLKDYAFKLIREDLETVQKEEKKRKNRKD